MASALPIKDPINPPDPADIAAIARTCVCFQTRMTAHAVTRAYNKALSPFGLEVTQFNILAALASGPSGSVTALSDTLALDRTTMTRNLKRLESLGLVTVANGPGRAMRPSLTPAGTEKLVLAIPFWQQIHGQMEAAIGAETWQRTRDGLRTIRRVLKSNPA